MGPGGRLNLLQFVRRYPDELEQDLADRGHDLRDWYRPRGGPSRMTTRRLLLLVDGLPHGSSRFWSAVLDRDPVTDDQIILSDIFMALTKNVHPVRTRREDAKKRREMEAKKARVAKRERRRRRYRTTT